jgi:hypothetical protein
VAATACTEVAAKQSKASVRCAAGSLSFYGQKESDQRKGPFPTEQTEDWRLHGDFPTRQSLARSENDAHPCASPFGSAICTGALAGVKIKGLMSDIFYKRSAAF